jgi:hypothetical protein
MKDLLPEKNHIYTFWKHFLEAFLLFVFAWVLLSLGSNPDSSRLQLDFDDSFKILGFFAILACCYFAAKWMERPREHSGFQKFTGKEFADNLNEGVREDSKL